MLGSNKIIRTLSFLLLVGFLTACGVNQTATQPKESEQQTKSSQINTQQPTEKKAMPSEALYVCQTTMNQLAVVDLAKHEVVKQIPVGAKPLALIKSPDNHFVYVANSGSGDIYMVSTSSGEVEAKIAMGNQPVDLAISSTGDRLYALDHYLNRVSVIDLNLRSMVGFYPLNSFGFEERIEAPDCCSDMFGEPLGAGRKPSTLILDEDQGKIYVGNLGTWDLAIIDINEEKEVAAFDATFGINDILIAGSEKKIYISAAGNKVDINDFILTLDLERGGTLEKLKIGSKPTGMALSPDGQIIYIITQNDCQLTGLNANTGKIIAQCSLEGELGDIVLSEDGSRAYVANLLDGTVHIIDTKNYSLVKIIEAGITPKELVYVKQQL